MKKKIKIKLNNKTLNQHEVEEGYGILQNNQIMLKNTINVFKINTESNIIFKKETEDYILCYEFIKGAYTKNFISFNNFDYYIKVNIFTNEIIITNNKIVINYEKYIEENKEECELIIEYKE